MTETTEAADLESVVAAVMRGGTYSESELDQKLQQFRTAFQSLTEEDVQGVKRTLIERLRIDMDLGVAVMDTAFAPWLDQRYAQLEWSHWLAYKEWLVSQHWPLRVIDSMDLITNRLLDYAGDPARPGHWARRGLAIGDVQSGKTATYLGLFNKAVDAGYRLIIVFAGGTELLRQQTQRRVDEGLIGRDSRVKRSSKSDTHVPSRYVGVGTIDTRIADATGMTTVAQDFRKVSYEASNVQMSADAHSAYVFVLKKNRAVLDTLSRWLDDQPKNQGRISLPVLVLDDESDYASVNTKDDENPTVINEAIRGLLRRFSRSTYLAFTATPFANIFIDSDQDDDLFPRDYVYALQAPSNYVGATKTFGSLDEASDTPTASLQDAHGWLPVKHRANATLEDLCDSLLDAIDTFFVANAIRDLRGDDGPRSMLINVSRFKAVQRQVFELVAEETRALRNALDMHARRYADGEPNALIDRLQGAYAQHYTNSGVTWPQVLGALRNAGARIEVQLHNSDRDKAMADQERIWDMPPRVIAVGGDVLSRGVTLSGLMVSYFHRNVGAYDTLMQMARWFGFRDGYADLCRVWIDADVAAQYRFVQDAIDELRLDLAVMHQQGLTPQDFGLAVRKHPGALLVTARNKMKATEDSPKEISIAGRRVESTHLSSDDDLINLNLRAFAALTAELAKHPLAEHPRHRLLWRDIPKELVADFLDDFRTSDDDTLFLPGSLARFVRGTRARDLQRWDVLVVGGSREAAPQPLPGAPELSYHPPVRTLEVTRRGFRVSGKSSRLAGSDDVASLVTPRRREEIKAEYVPKEDQGAGSGPGELDFYGALPNPVLFVYPLNAPDATEAAAALEGRPLVAAKIAIPSKGVNDPRADVRYVINKVAKRKWFPEFIENEDEDDIDQ